MSNKEQPLVSVIVPIFNTENYLSECIESLLEQTYEPLEIILVDDGSTDNSGKICDNYAANNSMLVVLHTKNQGRTKARLSGVEHAHGAFVSFVDADDYVAPNYVEHLVTCLLEHKVDVSGCQSYNVYGENKSLVPRTEFGYFDKNEIEKILINNFLFDERTGLASISHYLHCKLFKRTAILQVLPRGINLWVGEDTVGVFLILLQSDSIYISNEPLHYYRQHESQTIKRMDRERWDGNVESFQSLADIDNDIYLKNQLPLYILCQLRDWLKSRYLVSNSYGEFKSDMVYALNNETMEKYFMHKDITTSNKRHRILAFLAQHKMYFLYYMIIKVHLATLKIRG